MWALFIKKLRKYYDEAIDIPSGKSQSRNTCKNPNFSYCTATPASVFTISTEN